MKTENVASFSEIFNFAKTHYNMTWNAANDLFFDTVLTYKGTNTFELCNVMLDNEDPTSTHKSFAALQIIKAFMLHHNVIEMRVIND